MKREVFISTSKNISLAVWDDVSQPKCIVQIAHGMAEHIARYDDFARFLNENGIIVIGDDHRGHGETDKDRLGLAEGDIFEDTVSDMRNISQYAKTKYGLPLILFGHSYGSFLSQRYLCDQHDLSGVILCGSALQSGAVLTAGRVLSKLRIKNPDQKGIPFAKLTFVSYDKKVAEGRNAWLNTDKKEVEKYNADKMCGFACSNAFYYYFFKGINYANKNLRSSTLKMLIISGAQDHVGGCGKLVEKLYAKYKKAGYDARLKLYDKMRHEILNEKEKKIVYKDVLDFILSCL